MKKFCLLAMVMITMLAFASCGRGTESPAAELPQPVEPAVAPVLRVAAMRGPTALGLLHLMNMHEEGNARNEYAFEFLGAPVEVPPLLVQNAIDFASIPGNLSSILYNQLDGQVQALAIVTLGVLHIVDTTGDISSVADLEGRTIFITGQGATPEFALNYVLTQNGLTPGVDVNIEFRAEPPEIMAMLQTGLADVAMLPEPFLSTAVAQVEGLNVALDLTEEWDRVQPDYSLIMSVVVGQREFIESNPEAVAVFMEEYAASINFMTTYIPEAAQLVADFGLAANAEVAAAALPRTHIVFITGEEMRRHLTGFFSVLYEANPQSIGGELPGDDFFFIP